MDLVDLNLAKNKAQTNLLNQALDHKNKDILTKSRMEQLNDSGQRQKELVTK